jgi:hypothetical protein
VGIFPVTARVLIYHQWYKEKNKKGARLLETEMKVFNDDEKLHLTTPDEKITFIAENEKDTFMVSAEKNIIPGESRQLF